MKNLLLFALMISVVACQPANNAQNDTTVFSGKITEPNSDKLFLSKGDFKQEIAVNEDGTFSTQLNGVEEGVYMLYDQKEGTDLYILPGKDLQVTFDTKEFDETMTYTGAGAAPSNYLAQKMLNTEKSMSDRKAIFSKDEADFASFIVDIKSERLDFLNAKKDLPENFIKEEKKVINYEYLADLQSYSLYHGYYTGDDVYEASAEFMKPLENISLDNEVDFVNIPAYAQLVQSTLSEGTVKERLDRLQGIKSEKIRESELNSLMRTIRPGSETLEEDYELLIAAIKDEGNKKKLTEKFELCKSLAKGSPSPVFNFEDRNGKMVKLEDLKGKNIYIDVWATWCGPCIREIPDLKKLEAEYHNKNIEFVSISIDKMKDKEKWLAMVEEKELIGEQLMADKDWKSDFVVNYGIRGIPRFILLDDEGKIVSADAPRPSSGEKVKNMIEGLSKI